VVSNLFHGSNLAKGKMFYLYVEFVYHGILL